MDVKNVAGSAWIDGRMSADDIQKNIWTEKAVEEDTKEQAARFEERDTVDISEEGLKRLELVWQEENASPTQILADNAAGNRSGTTSDSEAEPEWTREYAEKRLREIEASLKEIRSLKQGVRRKETEDERLEALEEIRKLEEDQKEEYQKDVESAQKLSVKVSKTQSMVEEGNRNLVIMLESVRETEKDDKPSGNVGGRESEGGKAKEPNKEDGRTPEWEKAMELLSEHIRKHAFGKELHMDAAMYTISERADKNLELSKDVDSAMQHEIDVMKEAIRDPNNSDEEVIASVRKFFEKPKNPVYYDVYGAIYDDIYWNRMDGLRRMENLRELRRERRGDNQNMMFAAEAGAEISEIAARTAIEGAFRENYENRERETIEELEERVRELQGRKEAYAPDGKEDVSDADEQKQVLIDETRG